MYNMHDDQLFPQPQLTP